MCKVNDDISDDVEGITQWVWRKFRNHHPMSKRESERRYTKQAAAHKNVQQAFPDRQFITKDGRQVGYVLKTGECFLIEVKQVTPEQLKALVARP
jgi:hypothetical protein